MKGQLAAAVLILVPGILWSQGMRQAADESSRYGQAVADILRSSAGTPIAFVPAGVLKESLTGRDLAQALEFPEEELAVVKITGSQVRQALERSISLHPTPSPGFLHVSGLDVTFNPNAPADKRIVSVLVGSAPLDPSAEYRVAMPASLARGGLGYFTVWSKAALEASSQPKTIESLVKGSQPSASSPRWKAAPSALPA
jgi:2',3'-cyclic-nucleotide 2'-phosphodiesterase (5'-nucleotidase family)